MITPNPDWLFNRLEVKGPDAALQDFIETAQGPGFVDWNWPGGDDQDYWTAKMIQGGAPSPAAAQHLTHRLAEKLWRTIAEARTASDLGHAFVPLDLNVLRPIPRKILRAGWHAAGKDWCWQHWGTAVPLRKATFGFEHRRQKAGRGIDVVAVYSFYSADWSPWRTLIHCRKRWQALRFEMTYEEAAVADPARMEIDAAA